jgi:hypothetical protein
MFLGQGMQGLAEVPLEFPGRTTGQAGLQISQGLPPPSDAIRQLLEFLELQDLLVPAQFRFAFGLQLLSQLLGGVREQEESHTQA